MESPPDAQTAAKLPATVQVLKRPGYYYRDTAMGVNRTLAPPNSRHLFPFYSLKPSRGILLFCREESPVKLQSASAHPRSTVSGSDRQVERQAEYFTHASCPMNAVEIDAAISELASQPFDAAEFPFEFLAAFGNKETAVKRLRTGNNNASDVPGGVLQRNNIHLAACAIGTVGDTLKALRASPATTKAKAKFILATDGETLEAEELTNGEIISCDYPDFANRHFGFFLPLAGISTIKEIKDNPIDVRATGRLNKLYVELLRENPAWATAERRTDMNHFMARLVFCFFAEDTDIFNRHGLFTRTVERMSASDGSNAHEVLSEIFRAMNIRAERARAAAHVPSWADGFPYVNGGLFSGSTEVPRFTRMARTYLLHTGALALARDQPGHLRQHDPGRGRRRRARRAGHALHQRAQHPEGVEPAVSGRAARSWLRPATTSASC
jgi:hypothetical protein